MAANAGRGIAAATNKPIVGVHHMVSLYAIHSCHSPSWHSCSPPVRRAASSCPHITPHRIRSSQIPFPYPPRIRRAYPAVTCLLSYPIQNPGHNRRLGYRVSCISPSYLHHFMLTCPRSRKTSNRQCSPPSETLVAR